MTLAIAIIHAFRRNADFQPTDLYLGALIVDLSVLQSVLK